LDDGTLVVVEQGQGHIGSEADVLVTNTRQTAQGRMIFARVAADSQPSQTIPSSPAGEARAAQQVSKA
jgi:hypothetical protein